MTPHLTLRPPIAPPDQTDLIHHQSEDGLLVAVAVVEAVEAAAAAEEEAVEDGLEPPDPEQELQKTKKTKNRNAKSPEVEETYLPHHKPKKTMRRRTWSQDRRRSVYNNLLEKKSYASYNKLSPFTFMKNLA